MHDLSQSSKVVFSPLSVTGACRCARDSEAHGQKSVRDVFRLSCAETRHVVANCLSAGSFYFCLLI